MQSEYDFQKNTRERELETLKREGKILRETSRREGGGRQGEGTIKKVKDNVQKLMNLIHDIVFNCL